MKTWRDTITQEEKGAVEEFRRRMINDVTPKLLEDDSLFYRFMKARDFNLKNAEHMLRKHISWRKEHQLDNILTDYKPHEMSEIWGPIDFIGFDREGCIVRYIDIGNTDLKGIVNSFKVTDIVKYNAQVLERDLELLKEQSEKLGRPITKFSYIYNFENFSFVKATNKKIIELMMTSARMFQDNYPERLKSLYQINVSTYYTIMFSVIKSVIAAPVLEKIQCFGSAGWKEALLEFVDADVLPAFLGGNRTDPDGNPRCTSIITHPQIIPESCYLRKSERRLSLAPDVKKLTVNRFSKSELKFDVEEADSLLEWEFETKCRDIGFGVYFRDKISHESKPVEIIPKHRIDTYFEPETGIYKCEKAGAYIIVFDNSYSWIYPKDIFYRARIIGPNDQGNC